MALAACPFCFSVVDTSQLAYQCSGRVSGDKRCEPAEDDARILRTGSHSLSCPTFTVTGVKRNTLVSCTQCGGPAKKRACSICSLIRTVRCWASSDQRAAERPSS